MKALGGVRRRPAARVRRRREIALAVMITLLAGGPGCAWFRPVEREGGTLTVAVPPGIPPLDPHVAAEPHPMFQAVYDTLLSRAPDLGLAPGLARAWQVSTDGLRITLDLRADVRFHDGTPLDGTAVVKNLERVLSGRPEEFPVQALLGPVREVNAAGLQVALIYDRPFPPVWQALTDLRLGMVSAAALAALSDGGGAPETGPDPLGLPGTGPYRVVSRQEDSISLERNPQYSWPPGAARNRGRAYPDALRVVGLAPDQSGTQGDTGSGALPGDEWDIVWWPAGVALPQTVGERTSGWRSFDYGGNRITYLSLDLTGVPFGDPVVRQAALMSVDRPGLLAAAPWPSRLAPGLLVGIQGGPAGTPPGPDFAAAERLLDSAGWIRGEDGLRRKGNETLDVRIATYEDDPGFQAMAAEVCKGLASVGFACRTVAARRSYRPGVIPSGPNAWLLYYQWPDPDVLYYLFHSSQVGKANRTGYSNRSVDALLEAARVEMNADLRTELYREAQVLIIGDGAVVPLLESRGQVLVSPRVAGFRPWPDGKLLLQDVYLKQAQ